MDSELAVAGTRRSGRLPNSRSRKIPRPGVSGGVSVKASEGRGTEVHKRRSEPAFWRRAIAAPFGRTTHGCSNNRRPNHLMSSDWTQCKSTGNDSWLVRQHCRLKAIGWTESKAVCGKGPERQLHRLMDSKPMQLVIRIRPTPITSEGPVIGPTSMTTG